MRPHPVPGAVFVSRGGPNFREDGSPRRNTLLDVLRHIAGYARAHAGQTPDVATIAADLGLAKATINRALNVLEKSGGIARALPWPGVPKIIVLLQEPRFAPVPHAPWFDVDQAAKDDWGGALPHRNPAKPEAIPHPAQDEAPRRDPATGMLRVPGYFERGPDPDLGTTTPRCFDRPDGKHFCMAHSTLVGSKGGLIIVSMEAGKGGLFLELSPEGVRRLCTDLLTVADKIETQHAATSNALLAQTLARKGGTA